VKQCTTCGAVDRTPAGACRPCQRVRNASEKAKAARTANRKTDRAKARAYARWVRLRYGVSVEDVRAMRVAQNDRCAICVDPLPSGNQAHIDHDHDTGQVRGILCGDCNRAEGMLRGSPLRAERLAAYLRKHAPKLRLVSS
jgi:hypothetical protein